MKRMLIVLLAGVTLCFAGCTGNRDNGGDGENTRSTDAKTEQTTAVTDAEPTGTRSDYSKNY